MHDDEPISPKDADLARALDAWAPLPPPADFAERVLAEREVAAPPRPHRVRRAYVLAGVAAGIAAAATVVVALRPTHRAESGTVVASARITERLGGRGVAVIEPASELVWRVDEHGAADLTQRTGNVFYRVERGGPFIVHTPAGDVRVTGTCFRIEVDPMNTTQKMLLSGVGGAALAAAVLVTVYEGRVIAETKAAHTELTAGSSATLDAQGDTLVGGAALDAAKATREQLVARTQQQAVELGRLRAQIARFEDAKPGADRLDSMMFQAEPGRMWYEPSSDQLRAWVAECHVRIDAPELERFTPLREANQERGIQPAELDAYNATMLELADPWKELVRGLYVEVTGDAAGADTLSISAMWNEIEDKSPPSEHAMILQRLSRERAGLSSPPTDLSKASALERLTRAYARLGDQTEAALAKRLGAERAHAIRGHGWGNRIEDGGCPKP